MKSNTVERVTEWDSEPFSGGHDGLRELADREFSGAATDGSAWLFMLNGRVIGVFGGDIASFADADGTAYAAPDPSLPLLFAMQETGGETRAEYYTEETPISEVNGTLESGNFTGYVELSENVLSGDYYVAYYGGRSLPVAFVGNSSERLTGDEAFERADDEVGIYEVNTIELEISDIPDPETASETTAAAGGTVSDQSSNTEATETGASTASGTNMAQNTGPEPVKTDPEPESESAAAREDESSAATSEEEPAPRREEDTGAEQTSSVITESGPASETGGGTTRDTERSAESEGTEAEPTPSADRTPDHEPTAGTSRAEPGGGAEPSAVTEEAWHGTNTVPALDPSESVDMSEELPEDAQRSPAEPTAAGAGSATQSSPQRRETDAVLQDLRDERDQLQERVAELEEENEHLGSENERLQGERERLERERDEANAKATELEREIEELESTIDRLEAELADAEAELDEVAEYMPEGDHEIPVDRAFDGTNLFVRYDRQGGPTLENAHDGAANREEVNGNLRLEHHTDFEAEGAIVDGEPFEDWLHETMEYGFASWLVETFIYEILETGNRTALGELFDAIPDIDRIEFNGSVELPSGEDEVAETASFDVVVRDRMGTPLIVANLNENREPATESMLGSLIQNATPVAKAEDSLASALFVTTSYYEPGALETAEEATGSGFLSRDKHKSFVKLSRSGGYHLCLVETREGEFHVSVPEL